MRLFIVLAVVAAVSTAPVDPEKVEVLAQQFDIQANGDFNSNVQLDNGISQKSEGKLVEVPGEDGKPVNALIIRGSYIQFDAEGKPQEITFVADQNGYRPEGPQVPKSQ